MARIFWKDHEQALVIGKMALIRNANPDIPWGQLLVQAQRDLIRTGLLPQERARPESTLLTSSKSTFERVVIAEQQRLNDVEAKAIQERAAQHRRELEEAEKSVPETVPVISNGTESGLVHIHPKSSIPYTQPSLVQSPSGVVLPMWSHRSNVETSPITQISNPAQLATEDLHHAMESAAGAVADIFFQYLYKGLVERSNMGLQKFAADASGIATTEQPPLEATAGATKATADVVTPLVSRGGVLKEVDDKRKLKVVVVDGADRGHNIGFIKDGLEDVYRFNVVTNLAETTGVKDADIIIRTQICSHAMWETVKRKNPNAKVMQANSSKSANELLTNYYLQMAEEKERQAQASAQTMGGVKAA